MTPLRFLAIICAITVSTHAFTAPKAFVQRATTKSSRTTKLYIFGEDEDAPKLTRDNEPEEFFSSKMDEMSDGEKLPIALVGLAGISLPFIAGLIFLYASK
ncbi:hypothetical protein TrLO_g4280 [Triparma laevis f. longispina]|uniref:RxLR effector protein n=1 Tax=Triparma laevis f. longispina TaxID=1714387 RepID=A0A9W6ZRE7_9STRA|nr:hypothetical protein TrLO_g4280 [Triparma laevis f. longispina]